MQPLRGLRLHHFLHDLTPLLWSSRAGVTPTPAPKMRNQQVLEQNLADHAVEIVGRELKTLLFLIEHFVGTPGSATKSQSPDQRAHQRPCAQRQATGHQIGAQPRGRARRQRAPQARSLRIHRRADLQLAT